MAESFSRGQGQFVGTYPVIESDLARMLKATEGIGGSVANIFKTIEAKRMQDFLTILEAIKAGIADPNQALVQGTPGGGLYKRFLGIEPPAAPTTETTYGQKEMPFSLGVTPSGEPEEPSTGTFLTPTTTTKRVGGFQPQTMEQLKQYIIKERLAGRQPEATLEEYAFPTKTQAQLFIKNPELAKEMERIKSDPRRAAVYQRAVQAAGVNYPNADPAEVVSYAIQQMNAFFAGEEEAKKIQFPKLGKTKGQMISEYKNADLNARRDFWNQRAAQGERALTIKEQQNKSRDWLSMYGIVSKYVGIDLAPTIADAWMKGENLDELPISEEIQKRVGNELKRKQEESAAKILAAKSLIISRGERQDLDERKFQLGADEFNARLKFQSERIESQGYLKWRDALLKSISVGLRSTDANARIQANEMLVDFAVNHLSVEALDPSGFQGFKEAIGRIFGVEGLGRPVLTTKPAGPLEKKPFNPPTVVPRKPGEGKKPQIKTFEDFMKKHQK